MRIPSFLRDRTLLLLVAPVIAVLAVLGAGRIDADTPTEQRAARASTTTTEAEKKEEAAGAAAGQEAAVAGAEVSADESVSESSDSSTDSFSDTSFSDASFDLGGLDPGTAGVLVDAVTPDGTGDTTTTTTTAPTTTTTTTVPTTSTTVTGSTSSTSTTTTSVTTTSVPGGPAVVTATTAVELDCSVVRLTEPEQVVSTFRTSALVGIASYDGLPAGQPLPLAVRLLGPTNGLGDAGAGELSHQVTVSASGDTAVDGVLQRMNGSPYGPDAVFLVPDDAPAAMLGQLTPSVPAGGATTVSLVRIATDRQTAEGPVSQRCLPVGGAAALVAVDVFDPSTTTTTVPLPTPVVDESPITALLPVTALVVAGLGLVLVMRRRRIVPDAVREDGGR